MNTILVIEDEAQTRNIFLRCLEFEGFRAVGANDGATGMAMAKKHQPDLVVCDIMMPDMDGYSVLSALRQTQHTAAIPLIFLTAKVTMADLRRGMELGADDYLTKPCTIEQFLTAINTRLQRRDELANQAVQWAVSSPQALESTPKKTAPASNQDVSNILPNCPKLASVFQFIETHYLQPISLQDVAQEVGYSPAYLTNLVHEHTGQSVKRWIIERRMAQARTLLINTAQTIRQIAEASGYNDAGYFTRQFRKFHGASPQVWRRESVAKLTD